MCIEVGAAVAASSSAAAVAAALPWLHSQRDAKLPAIKKDSAAIDEAESHRR